MNVRKNERYERITLKQYYQNYARDKVKGKKGITKQTHICKHGMCERKKKK